MQKILKVQPGDAGFFVLKGKIVILFCEERLSKFLL